MTGLFIKKYHVAVLDNNDKFISTIVNSLKSLYNNKIVVESYKDSKSMFEAVSVNEAKKSPFDLAVLSPSKFIEKLLLKRSNPDLKVILYEDEMSLKNEFQKVLL